MKNILVISILLSIAFTQQVFAKRWDIPPVPLSGGLISAGGELKWGFYKKGLQSGITYKVRCDITNNNYTIDNPAIIKIENKTGALELISLISVNGKANSHGQYLMNRHSNKLVFDLVAHNWPLEQTSLLFINYDKSDDLILENCIAQLDT